MFLVAVNQRARRLADDRHDRARHEVGVPGVEPGARVVGQRCELEVEESLNVQHAGTILRIKVVILSREILPVDDPFIDQILCPGVIAVAGQQGMVEVEQGKLHGGYLF